jgi:hypothetical protein
VRSHRREAARFEPHGGIKKAPLFAGLFSSPSSCPGTNRCQLRPGAGKKFTAERSPYIAPRRVASSRALNVLRLERWGSRPGQMFARPACHCTLSRPGQQQKVCRRLYPCPRRWSEFLLVCRFPFVRSPHQAEPSPLRCKIQATPMPKLGSTEKTVSCVCERFSAWAKV